MNNRVNGMNNAKDSIATLLLMFTRVANKSTTVCLFEGEDQKYYSSRIDSFSRITKWNGLECGGKPKVIELFDKIKTNRSYKKQLVLAFVDRDFDPPISTKNYSDHIYETPYYSIENFYCTNDCVSKILDIEFKLKHNIQKPNLHQQTLERYIKLRSQFHEAVTPLNFWIYAHRKKERTDSLKKLNLNNFKLSDYISVNFKEIKKQLNSLFIPSLFPDCHSLSYAEIAKSSIDFPLRNPELLFRGKYEIEFLRLFLMLLRVETKNTTSAFHNSEKNTGKLQLSKENIISELSQYASTPPCLQAFLKKNFH